MWCGKCQNDLSECVCPDINERLASVSNVAFKWCEACDKHYALCRCDVPMFIMKVGDKRMSLPGKHQ